jgi:DNA-binding MarR family transcriptional regulator
MGKMVGVLERDGFVTIKPSPVDGRVRIIELTDEGRRLHERAAPLWQNAQQEFERLNGNASVAMLRHSLREIVVGDLPALSPGD